MHNKVLRDFEYIFETSWEVCNMVGGIYTVVSTKYLHVITSYSIHYTKLYDKILANFLYVQSHKQTLWLADINGGNLHNAIPREASAVVFIPAIHKEQIRIDLNIYADEVQRAFSYNFV